MRPNDAHSLSKLRKGELIALLRRQQSALAIGREKGAAVQKLAATLRQNLIDRSVGDLLRNPESARWRDDAIVSFVFSRQREIGIRPPYKESSLDRKVRAALRKYRLRCEYLPE